MGQWSSQLRCQRSLTGAVRHVCSARSASRSISTSAHGTPSPGQARGLFNMSFPRAQVPPVPITPLSSGLSPDAGHRSSSNNIGLTPVPDVGLIGRPLAPIGRPSTSGTPTFCDLHVDRITQHCVTHAPLAKSQRRAGLVCARGR